MKKLLLAFCCAASALLPVGVHGENAAVLDLQLYAGVSISGAVSNVFAVQATSNLPTPWATLAFVQLTSTNYLFLDTQRPAQGQRLYRAVLQSSPTNMVFIPANTFLMGSPVTESNRNTNEGPQTLVTLSRGFWIGQYEVTEAEYLAVTRTNPSNFPEDLSRPVSSVSWPDATNYCALLTARELSVGRIPVGSRYRLPTEAEWECAARAGTSTRFSYGDDPGETELDRYAWTINNAGFTTPFAKSCPTPGVFTTCTATSGSGPSIGSDPFPAELSPTRRNPRPIRSAGKSRAAAAMTRATIVPPPAISTATIPPCTTRTSASASSSPPLRNSKKPARLFTLFAEALSLPIPRSDWRRSSEPPQGFG